MDVKEGFCWRCNKALRKRPTKCDSCGIAEYCRSVCSKDDEIRHRSVECPTWSSKTCGYCEKVGAINECSGCYSLYYCDVECQRGDWTNHRPVCRVWQKIVKQVASRPITLMSDYPFYFSNSFSNDLLNLQSNEMKEGESCIQRNFNILLPACGDLRHVMKTVQSLPDTFSSSLKFVLNDIDPFSMARNILLLFMYSCCEAEKVSSISTIWLSFKMPREDYLLLQEMLSKLINMDCTDLKKITRGGIDINEHSYNVIREVWEGWRSYSCRIQDDEECDTILTERKAIFDSDPMASAGVRSLLHDVPQRHASSIKKWFEDGLILPEEHLHARVTHYNPTFTGRESQPLWSTIGKLPSGYKFTYCIRSDCIPFQMWDYLDMMQLKMCDSISVMCHAFNTLVVAKTRAMMRDERLSFNISTVDFLKLGTVISRHDYEEGFDRIFASNLVDYYRVRLVLEALEPFLSKHNPHAALFTETFNWYGELDGAVWPTNTAKETEIVIRGLRDCNLSISDVVGRNKSCFHEYYDNMTFFINYLRGDMHAQGNGKGKLPKLSDVLNRSRLTMRDFRKERNHVVPFNQRVTVRIVNMLRGDVRTVEWYRKPLK